MYFCALMKVRKQASLKALGVGVMATLQILVLSLKVRVLHAQPEVRGNTDLFLFSAAKQGFGNNFM